MGIGLLRDSVAKEYVDGLWQSAREPSSKRNRECPLCDKPMKEVQAPVDTQELLIDVCLVDHFIWFDTGEYEKAPMLEKPQMVEIELPPELKELMATYRSQAIADRARASQAGPVIPDWRDFLLTFFSLLRKP